LEWNKKGFEMNFKGDLRGKNPERNLGKAQMEIELISKGIREGTCYRLVHSKLQTNSNTRPTQKHKHSPKNKSK
jgi:hypothetical protein